MREVLHRAMDVAGTKKLLLPAPAALVKLAAWPMRFLPNPPLSPGAVDFVNQPATVDVEPLLAAHAAHPDPARRGPGHLPRPRAHDRVYRRRHRGGGWPSSLTAA